MHFSQSSIVVDSAHLWLVDDWSWTVHCTITPPSSKSSSAFSPALLNDQSLWLNLLLKLLSGLAMHLSPALPLLMYVFSHLRSDQEAISWGPDSPRLLSDILLLSFTNHNRLNHTSWQCTEQRTMIPPSSQSGSESSPALSKDQSLWLCSFWLILFLGWAGHGCPELPLWMKSLASAFRDG